MNDRSGDPIADRLNERSSLLNSYLIYLKDKNVVYPFIIQNVGSFGHTTVLIYHSKTNELVHYDPNVETSIYQHINKTFFDKIYNKTGISTILSYDIHPEEIVYNNYYMGINSIITRNEKTKGLCQIISLFIAHLVLKFPEFYTSEILEILYKKFIPISFENEVATDIIIGFYFSVLNYLKKDLEEFHIDIHRLATFNTIKKGDKKLYFHIISYLMELEHKLI